MMDGIYMAEIGLGFSGLKRFRYIFLGRICEFGDKRIA